METNFVAPLHNETDMHRVNARIRRVSAVFGMMSLVAVALIIVSLIWRDNTHMHNVNENPSQIVTIAITLVWGSLIIFFWGMKLTPLLSYRRFLKEINTGLSREVEGVVVRVDEDTTFRENLNFYGIVVNVGALDNPEDERQLYWDAQLGRPQAAEGSRVWVRAHGNDIISFEKRQDGFLA